MICSLVSHLFQTDEAFTVDRRKHSFFDTKKYLLFTKNCFWEFHQDYEWKKCTFFGNFWFINVSKIEWSHRLVNNNSATYLKSCQTSIASFLLKCYQTYNVLVLFFKFFHLNLPYYLQLKSGISFVNNMTSSANKYKNKQISYK